MAVNTGVPGRCAVSAALAVSAVRAAKAASAVRAVNAAIAVSAVNAVSAAIAVSAVSAEIAASAVNAVRAVRAERAVSAASASDQALTFSDGLLFSESSGPVVTGSVIPPVGIRVMCYFIHGCVPLVECTTECSAQMDLIDYDTPAVALIQTGLM